jgi:multiple antibiotic resistance protein
VNKTGQAATAFDRAEMRVRDFVRPQAPRHRGSEIKGKCAPERDMIEAGKSLLLFLSALFPIVDPLGGSPIFLAMTREYKPSTRRALAWRIAMNSFFLLVGSYFIGTHILSFFGISLPVVQVGGGLVVISTGWTLLKRGSSDSQKNANQNLQPEDPFHNAFYPLTLPLTVGPGSISVAITLGANVPHLQGFNFMVAFIAILGAVLLAASIFLCYGFADRLSKIFGKTGMTVILQLTSFLVVCIGVQILWNGVSALLVSLPLRMH